MDERSYTVTKLSFCRAVLLCVMLAGAISGGFINGLLGTGGGIVMTYMYSFLLRGRNASPKDVFVSAMATILPISLLSLGSYSSEYLRDVSRLVAIAVPSALGGLGGAYLSTRVSSVLLERIFALLVIYAGIKMLF